MKINKLFHWLYFTVMMLPVFILPIFAIYTRNESNTFENNIELQVDQNKVVDFNQIVDNGNIYSLYMTYDDLLYYRNTSNTSFAFIYFPCKPNTTYRFSSYINVNIDANNFVCTLNEVDSNSNSILYHYVTTNVVYNSRFVISFTTLSNTVGLRLQTSASDVVENIETSYYKTSLYNLDQMGLTNSEFEQFYTEDYYDYTLSEIQLLKNFSTETLNDTDIASQMVYTMYQGVNKYFNYDSVFNFGVLYDWLQLTFFNGNATLGFFLMWHLLIYWLLTSLLWLLFDVLMYVPQLVHRWLDKASIS